MFSTDDTSTKCYNPKSITELDQLIKNIDEKIDYVAGATDLLVQDNKWALQR